MRKSQRDYKARLYAERRRLVDTVKLERGCVDCGYAEHPAALQFDHRDPSQKSWIIANGLFRELGLLLAEIAKCDVRCANCHAVRTNTVPGASGLRGRRPAPEPLVLFSETGPAA
jgi:hypothetical protein